MYKQLSAASAPRVEWELLPSLLNMLGNRRARHQPAWMETLPSELDVGQVVAQPIHDGVRGRCSCWRLGCGR